MVRKKRESFPLLTHFRYIGLRFFGIHFQRRGLTFNPLNPLLSLLLQRNPLELDFKEGDLIFFHQTSCYSFNKKEKGIIEYAYVEGGHAGAQFFSQPIRLGPEGVAEVLDYQPLHPVEQAAVDAMLPTLNREIEQGLEFVHQVMPVWNKVGI